MQWSMPHRVLQVVAGLIVLSALTSFTLGVINAPSRGRLPGERATGTASAPIEATDATPLSQERIEGPPTAAELTPEEKAKLDADKKAKAEAASLAAAEENGPLPVPPPATMAPTHAPSQSDHVGDLLDSVTPPPEEPPH
jgi:hypothetical protein